MFLVMQGVSKAFPGVQALQDVNFELDAGEVHALVGENGAGKSTLIKILGGVHRADSGKILLNHREVELLNPQHASTQGIAIVHQEFNLVPHLTVAENIFLGRLPIGRGGFVSKKELLQSAQAVLQTLGPVSPTSLVSDLSVAEMQLVEIGKALSFAPQVLIMDEPTAALNEREIERLFEIIRGLRDQGVGIIYISHHLDEVLEIADRCTVLRDGKVVGTLAGANLDKNEMISLMVGRPLERMFNKESNVQPDAALEVKDLEVPGLLHRISFEINNGEVLGVAGLMGAGQESLPRALFGLLPVTQGIVLMHGKPIRIRSPQEAIQHSLGWITEDRKEEGLVLSQSVLENISLASLDRHTNSMGFMQYSHELEIAQRYIRELGIRTPTATQKMEHLSGGNQQKVVLAKWLNTAPDVIIMSEPTRGIDVGAKADIYEIINELTRQGKAVLLISSDLPELLGMSDRLIVMYDGQIRATLDSNQATQEHVMYFATGGKQDEKTVSA